MIDASPSLLDRLSRRPDDADWRRLVDLYVPVLYAWLRPHGLQPSDLDDLTQEVLGVVAPERDRRCCGEDRVCTLLGGEISE